MHHRAGRTSYFVRRRLPRRLGRRARSGFATDLHAHSISMRRVYMPSSRNALTEPDLRQSQLGLYAQDQMRLGPWAGRRRAAPGLRHQQCAGDARRKTQRRPPVASAADVRIAVRPHAYVTTRSRSTDLRLRHLRRICKASAAEMVELGFQYNPMPAPRQRRESTTQQRRSRLRPTYQSVDLRSRSGQVRIRGADSR